MTTARMLPVGVIGLGAMGLRMACSILRAGHPVRGYDLRVEAMEELAGQGGAQSASAAEATRGAEIVLLVVVDAEQVEDVLFGSGKVAAALTRGAVVMVCSTVEPDYARRTGERLASMGIEMIDAPVSGGTGRASDGTLSIMASGPPAAFDKARPVMEAIGSKIYNLGRDCGQGSMMKTINQLLCGVHLAVSSEAMALGAKAGIDPHTLYEVICNSGGASFVFETHMIHVLEDDYTPRSAVDVFVSINAIRLRYLGTGTLRASTCSFYLFSF